MSQHDYVLSNQKGAQFREDLNNALSAIATNNLGTTEPATTYPGMWWADTTSGTFKQRNSTDDAWVDRFPIDSSSTVDIAATIHAADEKTTPVNDDEFGLVDSEASNVLKRFKWSSLVTALNSLYAAAIQSQSYTGYTTSGTSTAFTLTPSPAISANAEFKRFNLKFHTAPGDNPTLAISGQTALPIVYETSTGTYVAIVTGDVPSGWRTDAICTGTQYVITVPEARVNQFMASLAPNGYQKLPSGLIIQWGLATASAAGSAVTFPIAFPHSFLGVAGMSGGPSVAISIPSPTASGFVFYQASGSSSHWWIAIGY